MRGKITIEGMAELGGRDAAEMVIEKDFGRLSKGEIGLTIADGKTIMGLLQQLVVKQQCEVRVLTSRYCSDCQTFRRIKDYGKRKIRTVYGRVEVGNPRIMNCRRCLPYLCDASAVLRDIFPDQATPELMELSARMGSIMPYRKAADVLAEFLSISSTELFMTMRHRTMKMEERLDEKARDRAWVRTAFIIRAQAGRARSAERSGARVRGEHRYGACTLRQVGERPDLRDRRCPLRPRPAKLATGATISRRRTRQSVNCAHGHFRRSNMRAASAAAK